jgi:hypothetical protein
MHRTGLRFGILCFGIINACLYSALLPLWEGFDEPAHYGYVESLWRMRSLPVLGKTAFPADVNASFRFAPASYLMHSWLPEITSYEDWFRLPAAERAHRRAELDALRPSSGVSARLDYEAHQAPLAYLPLALIDWLLRGSPITFRILVLRLFAAIASALLLFFGASALCRELAVPPTVADAVLFSIFCSQMLYAATAHIGNDWLAVPVAAWCFASLAACRNRPSMRQVLFAAAWLGAGLLTKAYFLAFVPWAAAVAATMIWRGRIGLKPFLAAATLVLAIAAPWYARNMSLYGNLSGTYEASTGVTIRDALRAAPQVNWPATAGFLARGSLWMGNNSGTSFSRATLNAILVLLALALAGWAVRWYQTGPAERIVFAGIGMFTVAVAYAACSSFACRSCGFRGASPWYTQVLLAPVLVLAFVGLSRWNRIGMVAAIGNVALWTWVLAATWAVKLFPMYSGAGASPMRFHDVWEWYTHQAAGRAADLSMTALAPALVLYAGLLVAIATAASLSVAVAHGVMGSRAADPGCSRL